MNAVEQKATLGKAGYTYDYSGYMHEWFSPNGELVASDVKGTIARAIAYQHYLDAQAPTETPTSEAPAAPQVETVALEDAIHAVENYPVDAINLLLERIAKLESDNAAYERIVIQAGKDFEALKDENARMKESIAIAYGYAKSNDAIGALFELEQFAPLQTLSESPTPPAQEAPKRPVATRCRVNWNQRGFSSGSYEVLGYSQDKQVYVLNISTDSDKPMPKAVKMADCVVVL